VRICGFGAWRALRGLVLGAVGVVVATGVIWVLRLVVPVSPLAGVYVLVVLPVAAFWGVWPALLVAVMSALAFDFFFFPPVFVLTPTDPNIVTILAISVVTAVVVSALAERVRRRATEAESLAGEVHRFAEEQGALRRVATLVARAAAPGEVFEAVTAEVGRLLEVDFTVLSRYEADGAVTVVGAWGRVQVDRSRPIGLRLELGGHNLHTLVSQTRRTARIEYAQAGGPPAEVAREWGFRSAVGVPVNVEDRLWGVVSVGSGSEKPLPADTEGRLAGFTELVSTALANAEAQAALTASRVRIVAAADTARRRIERDLHDGAQQRLVSLALHLRGTVRAAVPPEADELKVQLDEVAAEVVSTLDELRELARGIHPSVLAKGGLRPALNTLARRSAVPVDLHMRIDERLPEQIEIAAYYVVSEALTNVVKHAHAANVQVEVQTGEGDAVLRVQVRDNGRGGADLSGGTGLVGLKDRVEALGGRLSVQSTSGAGTTVHAELPLHSGHVLPG
jgi:signal transduction histidine kinase